MCNKMLYDFLPELCNSEFKLNIESMCDDDIGENFCIGLLYVRTYSGNPAML